MHRDDARGRHALDERRRIEIGHPWRGNRQRERRDAAEPVQRPIERVAGIEQPPIDQAGDVGRHRPAEQRRVRAPELSDAHVATPEDGTAS